MSNLNKVMLIGRLTRDPEIRYSQSGQPVTSFSVATNRYGSSTEGERREFTDYHNVVAWNVGRRELARLVAEYCRKGSLVYVEGRLQTRSWEGQDGQKRYTTEVVANDVQFLDSRASREGGGTTPATSGPGRGPADDLAPPPAGHDVRDIDPDEIPF